MLWWPMSAPETITAFKDLILAGAGIVATVVATKGLSTWLRQLRGSADFECARSLFKAAYKVRDALQACRSPFIYAGEFPPEYHEGGLKKTVEQDFRGMEFVYRNRWNPVAEAMQDRSRRRGSLGTAAS